MQAVAQPTSQPDHACPDDRHEQDELARRAFRHQRRQSVRQGRVSPVARRDRDSAIDQRRLNVSCAVARVCQVEQRLRCDDPGARGGGGRGCCVSAPGWRHVRAMPLCAAVHALAYMYGSRPLLSTCIASDSRHAIENSPTEVRSWSGFARC